MFRIWIFLLLQRQSPGLGSADMPQQEGKSFLGIRWQLVRACQSIPLPQAELEQLIPRESHFSQPCPSHHCQAQSCLRNAPSSCRLLCFQGNLLKRACAESWPHRHGWDAYTPLTALPQADQLCGDRTTGPRDPPWPALLSLEGALQKCILLMSTTSQQGGAAFRGENLNTYPRRPALGDGQHSQPCLVALPTSQRLQSQPRCGAALEHGYTGSVAKASQKVMATKQPPQPACKKTCLGSGEF